MIYNLETSNLTIFVNLKCTFFYDRDLQMNLITKEFLCVK